MRSVAFIFLMALTSACANKHVVNPEFLSSFSQAVPVCEVLSHPKKYLGREISVGGLYGNDPHQRTLYDPSCSGALAVQISGDSENVRKDQKMEDALIKRKTRGIKSVYRGSIDSDPIIVGCDEDDCFRYKMTGAKLLGAEIW